ncbi:MAG: ABC transporter permease [Gammaproteobacteria bacterium]|nr:ABC transporter permease [Gammaproteobacteria bacterium]MBQ0839366.1 ABC transporter permease [Gammaproteobacteria bacterium]
MFIRLAWHSLLSRKGSVVLTFLAISVSIFVLLGIEHIRQQAKFSFSNTVSGVDLIVGARTGDINLLLYAVFQLGNATNNIAWASYREVAEKQEVAWTIPLSLGDSHKGYRVMGTTSDYFKYFRYGQIQALRFTQGKAFASVFDVVLGADVARKLNYQLDDHLVLAHGVASTSFSQHDDKPFRVVGILKPTGTPVDQTVHVSLRGIEAIHIDWQNGVKTPGHAIAPDDVEHYDLTPKTITAFMVGLKSKMATFRVQRAINNYQPEPLLAILPGVTLTQLWQMMAIMENTLMLVSALVLLASLLGLSAMLLTSIRERQREIAIMRSLGASPSFLFLLIQTEALLITLASSVFALSLLFICLLSLRGFLTDNFNLSISANVFDKNIMYLLLVIVVSAMVTSLIPAISAYSTALQKRLNNG